jgi:2-hydroxychromene-2-carboxylate isomerase
MSTGNSIDFWFSIGSTYSYLSVMRLPELARTEGLEVRWRPFNVRRIMIEMDNRHLAGKPVKYRYMWRDIERRAAVLGFPANVPVPHPIAELDFANRVAVLGMAEGWGVEYVRASYLRWFRDGLEPGSDPNLSESLIEIGQDPARVRAEAAGEAVGLAYDAATDEARALGIFGSPSFIAGGELFWGDDRIEHAINWLRHGSIAPRS